MYMYYYYYYMKIIYIYISLNNIVLCKDFPFYIEYQISHVLVHPPVVANSNI